MGKYKTYLKFRYVLLWSMIIISARSDAWKNDDPAELVHDLFIGCMYSLVLGIWIAVGNAMGNELYFPLKERLIKFYLWLKKNLNDESHNWQLIVFFNNGHRGIFFGRQSI